MVKRKVIDLSSFDVSGFAFVEGACKVREGKNATLHKMRWTSLPPVDIDIDSNSNISKNKSASSEEMRKIVVPIKKLVVIEVVQGILVAKTEERLQDFLLALDTQCIDLVSQNHSSIFPSHSSSSSSSNKSKRASLLTIEEKSISSVRSHSKYGTVLKFRLGENGERIDTMTDIKQGSVIDLNLVLDGIISTSGTFYAQWSVNDVMVTEDIDYNFKCFAKDSKDSKGIDQVKSLSQLNINDDLVDYNDLQMSYNELKNDIESIKIDLQKRLKNIQSMSENVNIMANDLTLVDFGSLYEEIQTIRP